MIKIDQGDIITKWQEIIQQPDTGGETVISAVRLARWVERQNATELDSLRSALELVYDCGPRAWRRDGHAIGDKIRTALGKKRVDAFMGTETAGRYDTETAGDAENILIKGDEAMRNGALIVSAPELLKVAQILVGLEDENGGIRMPTRDEINVARTAINKTNVCKG